MPIYLAFLRAINLGAKRVFPKDDIRRAVEDAGFDGVQTHINTGNVRFESRLRSTSRIEAALESAFVADRGFEVPTMVYTAREIASIAEDARALDAEHPGLARHYVYFVKNAPSAELTAQIEATATDAGEMVVRGRAVHALLGPGYQDGKVDPLRAAKLIEPTTSRNVTVVYALADKWC